MKTVVIIALFMAFAGIALVESRVNESHLVKHNDKNYYFSGSKATWFEASHFCELNGMRLIKINDSSENSFIRSTMNAKNLGDVFTSGFKTGTGTGRSDFSWGDGTPLIENYGAWHNSEPNRDEEYCIMVRKNEGWHNIGCDSKRYFVCEVVVS